MARHTQLRWHSNNLSSHFQRLSLFNANAWMDISLFPLPRKEAPFFDSFPRQSLVASRSKAASQGTGTCQESHYSTGRPLSTSVKSQDPSTRDGGSEYTDILFYLILSLMG